MDIPLNGTKFDDGPTLLFAPPKMEDGDHQLFVYIESLKQNGTVAVDYFEYVTRLTPRRPNNSVPSTSLIPGLRIYLDGASIFSGPGQTQPTYQKKRSSWTIPARI